MDQSKAAGRSGANGTMKAIHIKDFVKSLDEITPSCIPIPPVPQNRKQPHYLIKITYTSPTHVDTLYARGLHQNNNRERGHVHPPFVLGTEFSGIVQQMYPITGSASSGPSGRPSFKKGDRVWGTWLGAFATYVIVPQPSIFLLPSQLSMRDAAALGASTAPVSYGALLRIARLKKGETCLVHAAAGGLGIVAVQIALAVGAKVIGTVSSDAKARVIERLIRQASGNQQKLPQGCGVVKYDHQKWEDDVKSICGNRGVDVVFDTVGLVEKSIRCCNFGARVVVIGFVGLEGKMEKVAMNRVLLKQIQLLGYRYGETGRRMPWETIEIWKGLDAMLETGKIKPVVHQEFQGLNEVPEALKLMTTREVGGKIVIEMDDEDECVEAAGAQTQGNQVTAKL